MYEPIPICESHDRRKCYQAMSYKQKQNIASCNSNCDLNRLCNVLKTFTVFHRRHTFASNRSLWRACKQSTAFIRSSLPLDLPICALRIRSFNNITQLWRRSTKTVCWCLIKTRMLILINLSQQSFCNTGWTCIEKRKDFIRTVRIFSQISDRGESFRTVSSRVSKVIE